jgi:hypothetical protein
MFNRALKVSVIKDEKKTTPTASPDHFYLDNVVYATESVKTLVRAIGGFVITYVALDTVRQVAIAYAKKQR